MVLRLQLRRLDDTGPVDLPEVDCGMEPLVLGRNPASDLVLADPDRLVSSSHARIEPAEDGYRLVDTSVNGILLNEEKLPSNAVVTLAVGDLIQIMRYELRVVALDSDASSQPSLAGWFAHYRNPIVSFGLFLVFLLTLPVFGMLLFLFHENLHLP